MKKKIRRVLKDGCCAILFIIVGRFKEIYYTMKMLCEERSVPER